jgi:DNA-binding CsgD family transcriptional regulator
VPIGYLVFHAVCISSALGALIVLAAMYRMYRARGLAALCFAFVSLLLSYALGTILMWGGTRVPFIRGGTAEKILLSVKFLLQTSVTVWFPLAARRLLSRRPTAKTAAVLWIYLFLCAACFVAFLIAPAESEARVLSALGVFGLVSFAASLAYAISLPLRCAGAVPPRYRPSVRIVAISFLILVEAMMVQDAAIILGAPLPPGVMDGACFFLLSVAIIVYCLDVLFSRVKAAGPLPTLREFGLAHGLTDREMDVLGGLLAGRTYKEIGLRYSISIDTVKTHAGRVYKKTGAASRGQLRYLCRPDSEAKTAD